MGKNVQKWLDRVEYDLQTAVAIFEAGRYIYVVFMCPPAIGRAGQQARLPKNLFGGQAINKLTLAFASIRPLISNVLMNLEKGI